MKYTRPVAAVGLSLILSAANLFAVTPSPEDSADPLLGKSFRSSVDGIQFNPPVGGAKMRELNTGVIVQFVYADSSWVIKAKPVPLSKPMQLSASPNGGVLEIIAEHLTDSNPTMEILHKQVKSINKQDVGLLQVRYSAGTERVFAQQAIFKDDSRHYLSLEMTSKGKDKAIPGPELDADEAAADTAFVHMLQSVQVLDRQVLAMEQKARVYQTSNLWVLLDQKRITAALQPMHLMRVVRDGKEVGFIQLNEQLKQHNGTPGVEIVLHSRIQVDAPVAAPGELKLKKPIEPGAVIVPRLVGPAAAGPATQPAAPEAVYTHSVSFVTFDRDHEDWTTLTQTDDQVKMQLLEEAYSDRTVHNKLLPQSINNLPKSKDREPPTTQVSNYNLDVKYTRGKQKEQGFASKIPGFYLPQAMGQLLPRLIPADTPEKYLFAFYVSGQRNMMSRYVDVEMAREVEIDGQLIRAVPIADRIGADGIATIHYVTRQGEWLASINEESKTQVLPTDEKTLKAIWPNFRVWVEQPDIEPDIKLEHSVKHPSPIRR